MTITKAELTRIIESADEVITALAGTNDDIHPDNSTKMCAAWDDLNDRNAPPSVVKRLAELALAGMEAEPVAWLWSNRKHPSEVTLVRPEDDDRAEAAQWSGWSCQALYSAPQPATVVPNELTREEYKRRFMGEDNFDDTFRGGWRACRAAMLNANHSVDADEKPSAEPVSNRDELPAPVKDHKLNSGPEADDYYVGYQSGWNECIERYQAAMTNQSEQLLDMVNSPVIPDGWVACSERMPETRDWVIAHDEVGTVKAYICEHSGEWIRDNGDELYAVTHWMPLPAAPQQEISK